MIKEDIYLLNEPLSKHTTFKIGGPAKFWVEPADVNELRSILEDIKDKGLRYKVIGNGSNVLVRDKRVEATVIKLTNFNRLGSDCNSIRVGSGVGLDRLIRFSMDRELSGLEFLAGIPGTVGGAIKTNAGAFGKEISDVLDEICVMNKNGRVHTISKDKVRFGYRSSDIRNDTIILEAKFCLSYSSYKEIHDDIETALRMRKDRYYAKSLCAGSVFKNPDGNSAGEIIDSLGLKGTTRGRAMISKRHANIIVNLGRATAEDVKGLIDYIRDRVYKEKGVKLELEIECW